jgi:adenosine deaminase
MKKESPPSWLANFPKVELHLHLEGAIPLPALWQLIEKYDAVGEVVNMEGLVKKFLYHDFAHFIRTWVWKNNFLREYDDFTFIAAEVASDLSIQGIRYVEAFYSPGDFARHGLEPQKLTEAVRRGLHQHDASIKVNLVADLIRDFGPQKGLRWLREVNEVKNFGVLGIGIGGSEKEYPPEAYRKVYEEARNLGFRTSAHAGEAAGPKSIWGAVQVLRVDRIGHGTRADEDPALVKYLAQTQLPVEMCPISNVRTAVVPDLQSHPINKFFQQGLLVSVNTDDPKMFNTSLNEEYLSLMNTFGWGHTQITKLIQNAIRSAWCDQATKQKLFDEVARYVQNLP